MGLISTLRSRLRGPVRASLQRLRLWASLRNVERKSPILVYQMGKVGSSTVLETVRSLDLKNPIVQVHTLNPAELARAVEKERATRAYLPEHLITSSILIPKLKTGAFPATVITLTREPVGRAISFAFEDWRKKALDARQSDGTLNTSLMEKAAVDMMRGKNGHSDPALWFDREVRTVFGIDVFEVPYDFEKGFMLVKKGCISLLVIRMEDLDRALPKALEACLGVDAETVNIKRANEGSASWYAEDYRAVRRSFSLPPDVESNVLNSRYVQHFYARERADLRRQWQT